MGLYTVQGTDMGETSPPESSGWAGRVFVGAMHTAGPDCVALGLSFVINPENESETERVVLHWPRSGAHPAHKREALNCSQPIYCRLERR